jgi:hypothetical protein
MNPEIKSKWIAALRSGQYEQARGGLMRILHRNFETGKIGVGFCCLGVLCDLASQESVCRWQDMEAVTIDMFGRSNFNGDSLPAPVAEWAGLKESDPEVGYHAEVARLSELNDSYRLTFSQIADVIEENL